MRKKKNIAEMMPVKKWLSSNEACAYLDLSITKFTEIRRDAHLSVSALGSKLYFKVQELDQLFEDSIIIRKL